MEKTMLLFILLSFLSCQTDSKTQSVFLEDRSDIIPLKSLGHYLFFDKKLSKTQEKSCATCHNPILAFSDGYRRGRGIQGNIVKRNTPSILNLDNNKYFNWADSTILDIYHQLDGPLFHDNPDELGLKDMKEIVLQRFNEDERYQSLWQNLKQNNQTNYTFPLVKSALVAYVKGLNARQSAYDLFLKDSSKHPLPPKSSVGRKLFFDEKYGCFKCHGGIDFDTPQRGSFYVDVGLGVNDEIEDLGLYEVSKEVRDSSKFRIPSLRNVVITKPYYHDGRQSLLSKVVNHPKAKERQGIYMPNKQLSTKDVEYMVNFLHILTDTSYLRDSYFRDPFTY